jgi:hypothetical protein
MPDARLLVGATALLGAGAVGLGIPAPTPRIESATHPLEFTEPDPDWPEALHRWVNAAYRGLVPTTKTAGFVGSGRIRLGRSPWLPVSYRTSHELGHAFGAELAATWYGKAVIHAVDGFADGRGVSSVRGQCTMGPGLDQGAIPFLWSEAILIPSTWSLPGVQITQNSDSELTVRIDPDAPVAGPLDATITLDVESGLPKTFSVPWRAQDPEGNQGSGWLVDYQDWQPSDHGSTVRLAQISWADDTRPWLRLRLEPPVLGCDVNKQIAQIRDLQESCQAAG